MPPVLKQIMECFVQEINSKKRVAVKKINIAGAKPNDKIFKQIQTEVEVHSNLKHHAILRAYGGFSDQGNFYFVTELARNGSLGDHLKATIKNTGKGFSEHECCGWMKSVCEGGVF